MKNYLNLTIDDININDIIRGLPKLCRYNGRLDIFFSVAQHSVELCRWLKLNDLDHLCKISLFHDACEVYIGDLILPLKMHFPKFVEYELYITNLIYDKFHINKEYIKEFDYYDKNIVVNEMYALGILEENKEKIKGLAGLNNLKIMPWDIKKASVNFIYELDKWGYLL